MSKNSVNLNLKIMKKIYFNLFLIVLLIFVTQFTSGQKKKILYVGADAYYGVARFADISVIDSIVAWGYDTVYMGHAAYDASTGAHTGIDGVFFGESCGSNSLTPFGNNGEKFPVPALALEAAALGVEAERWAVFNEESSAGAGDGGGIVVHTGDIADATDNQIKITDNTHYITEIFAADEVVTWSTSTSFALVPYIQGVKYNTKVLAKPVAPVTNDAAFAMGMIENNFPKIKIFFLGNTHALINGEGLATPEFFTIIKRAIEHTIGFNVSGVNDNTILTFDLTTYPNPAFGQTTIRFQSEKVTNVKISLLTITGNEIDVLYNQTCQSGFNGIQFNAADYNSGVYLIKLQTENKTEYSKIILQ